jgi:hypothetical protein
VFADEVDTAATAAFEAAYGRGERGRHLALGRFAAV